MTLGDPPPNLEINMLVSFTLDLCHCVPQFHGYNFLHLPVVDFIFLKSQIHLLLFPHLLTLSWAPLLRDNRSLGCKSEIHRAIPKFGHCSRPADCPRLPQSRARRALVSGLLASPTESPEQLGFWKIFFLYPRHSSDRSAIARTWAVLVS